MHRRRFVNDAVLWYMDDLRARVVAESGIPSDRYHLGKLILQSFKDAPDFVMQIDGSTGESETNSSALQRSVQCATAFRKLGLQPGDVIVLMAPNHLDLAIPLYAALFLGVTIAAVDRTLNIMELQGTFSISKPKVIFCQSERAGDVQLSLNQLELDAQVVTFDAGDGFNVSFADFLMSYGEDYSVEDFRANDFDPDETISFLISTSGTTGLPKAAAATHKNFAITGPYWWSRYKDFPTPTQRALVVSPLQWLTAIHHFMYSVIFRYTRIQSSRPLTTEHAYYLINTYRPTYTVLSPTFMTSLLKPGDRDQCDFSCLDIVYLGGSAVPPELLKDLKEIAPNVEVCNAYGMSELTSIAFHPHYSPEGSCGIPIGSFEYRLIDIETQKDITEPYVQGELWMKGPGIVKAYYDNPEATAETFAEDRWFKTGDIFYRDENWYFYFVERYKLLLKYKSHHISPVEVENVIRKHPGVLDVAVTGIPDPECGDLAVACVVKKGDHDVTAQDIKELVRESLTDSKQLRGGVIFVDEIPLTATGKIHRRKLREIVLEMQPE